MEEKPNHDNKCWFIYKLIEFEGLTPLNKTILMSICCQNNSNDSYFDYESWKNISKIDDLTIENYICGISKDENHEQLKNFLCKDFIQNFQKKDLNH